MANQTLCQASQIDVLRRGDINYSVLSTQRGTRNKGLSVFEEMALIKAKVARERLLPLNLKLRKSKTHHLRDWGWWRTVIKTKLEYSIRSKGEDPERSISQAKTLLHWKGEWTLRKWWSRIPHTTLWEYARVATEQFANRPNPEFFAKCLNTAATLWQHYPERERWYHIITTIKRLTYLSLKRLEYELRKGVKGYRDVAQGRYQTRPTGAWFGREVPAVAFSTDAGP